MTVHTMVLSLRNHDIMANNIAMVYLLILYITKELNELNELDELLKMFKT